MFPCASGAAVPSVCGQWEAFRCGDSEQLPEQAGTGQKLLERLLEARWGCERKALGSERKIPCSLL